MCCIRYYYYSAITFLNRNINLGTSGSGVQPISQFNAIGHLLKKTFKTSLHTLRMLRSQNTLYSLPGPQFENHCRTYNSVFTPYQIIFVLPRRPNDLYYCCQSNKNLNIPNMIITHSIWSPFRPYVLHKKTFVYTIYLTL